MEEIFCLKSLKYFLMSNFSFLLALQESHKKMGNDVQTSNTNERA